MKLRELMKSKGITTKKLSELSGISARTIEQYVCERCPMRNARAYVIIPLAEALDVHPKDLLEEPSE